MSFSGFDIVLAFIGLSASLYLYYTKAIRVRVPKGLQLPPGPPRHPIWGNLKDLPSGTLQYRVYEKWAKKYGDLVYFNILGQSMLLISSAEIQRELFVKRSLIYSDRQKTTMMHDLTDFGNATLITMNYGEQWNRHRAIIHDLISPKRVLQYRPLLETTARSFARRLVAERVTDLSLTRDVFGKFIMQFVYGIDTLPENDPYVKLAERTVHAITGVLVPGAYMVDTLPIMKYLPSWLPGLKFPQAAEELNKNFRAMLNLPYEYTKTAYKQGNFSPSFVSDYLEDLANNPNSPEDAEDVIRKIAVTLYIAGIDTMETQIRLFALAMALHPDIQRKAQEELDSVIGKDNLPTFADLPNLPYVNALVNESLRWPVMVPLGLPHQLKQDDVVNGYFIPKGTICIGNTWLLLRSQQEYGPDTHKFRPERFLDGSAKLKPDIAFGYGRRICPGKALAESLLNIMIATILHVANISMLEDEPLADIIENHDFSPGAVARPRDFRLRIDARPSAQNLLDH